MFRGPLGDPSNVRSAHNEQRATKSGRRHREDVRRTSFSCKVGGDFPTRKRIDIAPIVGGSVGRVNMAGMGSLYRA